MRQTQRNFLTVSTAGALALLLANLPHGWVGGAYAGDGPETPKVRIGIIALTDCSSIVMAHELGLFKKYGIESTISKEASWAVIRDRLTLGENQATHLLLGMPYASMFARQLGLQEAFPFACAEEVFEEFKQFMQGRPMDITGVTYAQLKEGPVQWPCPAPDHPGTPRLYADRRVATPDGRARFIPVEHADPVERPSREFPLVLTTGRVKNQWHTMTRTGKVENLLKSCGEPFVELHPQDARRYGVQDGDFVELTSRRGKLVAQARVTATIVSGTCFVPFHWGRSMGFYKCANNLTLNAYDPVSKEPELKAAAVRVKKLDDGP